MEGGQIIQQIKPLHNQLPNLIKKSSKNCIPLESSALTIEGKF
jgi:hypothetical protein